MNPKPFVLRPTRSALFVVGLAILLAFGGLVLGTDRFPWFLGPATGIAWLLIGWRLSVLMRVDEHGFMFHKHAAGEAFDTAEVRCAWDEIEDVMLSDTRPPYVFLRLRDGTTSSDVTVPPKQLARLTRAVEGFGGRP